jgi:hypothetical protein
VPGFINAVSFRKKRCLTRQGRNQTGNRLFNAEARRRGEERQSQDPRARRKRRFYRRTGGEGIFAWGVRVIFGVQPKAYEHGPKCTWPKIFAAKRQEFNPAVICGKQNGEYALDCGAANPGCRRFSAGACGDRRLAHVRKSRLKGGRRQDCLPHKAGRTSAALQ